MIVVGRSDASFSGPREVSTRSRVVLRIVPLPPYAMAGEVALNHDIKKEWRCIWTSCVQAELWADTVPNRKCSRTPACGAQAFNQAAAC